MYRKLIDRYFPWLVYLVLFLLPWQTRYVFGQKLIDGQPFEYGTMSLYAVELLIALAFFVGQRLHLKREHRPSIQAMGILLLASAASIPFSIDPDLSLGAWSHLLFAAMLFVLLLDQRLDRFLALGAFVLGLIPPSILGFLQVVRGSSPAFKWLGLAAHRAADLGQAVVEVNGDRLLRAYGSFNHPNVFGGFLVIGLIATFILITHLSRRSAWLLTLPILSFALVSTFSRSAVLSLIAATVVGGGLVVTKHGSKIKPHLPLLSGVILIFALACIVFRAPLFSRLDGSQRLEQISADDRIAQFAVYPEVLDGHWAIGVGLGAYSEALAAVQPGKPSYVYQPIHNVPLLLLAEVGLLGALAAFFWASRVDALNYAAIRRRSTLAIGGLALGTVPLVVIFFDHYFWSSWSGLALLAFLMSLTLRLSEDV